MHDVQHASVVQGLSDDPLDSLDDGRITFDPLAGTRIERRDPVCGRAVPEETQFAMVYQAEQYRFCSKECRNKFIQDPRRYLG
jgi:YHS domain-containing protein